MSRVFPGLLGDIWTWDFGSHVWLDIPGCPELSQDYLGPGILVVMFGRTSRDVPSCLRISWDIWTWDSGSQVW